MKRNQLIVIAMVLLVLLLIVFLFFLLRPQPKLTATPGNPFGDTSSGQALNTTTTEPGTGAAVAGKEVAPNLIEITPGPVAGGEVALDIPAGIATSSVTSAHSSSTPQTQTTYTPGDVEVRYIDRESGNVYSYLALSRKLSRVSAKTLPGIQTASWLPDGSMAFVQFLAQAAGTSHINTYALPYDGNGGYFLDQDLAQVSVLGQKSVFVLTANGDSSIGSVGNPDGTNVKTVFTSPMSALAIHPAGAGLIATTKDSAHLDGYAFAISGNTFTPILGPLSGLILLPSPNGKVLLYSYTDGTTLHMAALDLSTGAVTTLPLATLAEKCVWDQNNTDLYCAIPSSIPDGATLPDDWYQGAASFTDKIWRIDLGTRLATLVVDPSSTGKVDIDAVNLTIDPNSQVLIFRNKKDSSLWAYTLAQ